uniref:Actin n=1 Tax=Heliothis virescens TaxID=7102 RepID=A0A2A4JQM4_HELVI
MPFTKPVVVIDNGSFNIKAGFACDNHPVSIFRTVVGRPKFLKGTYGKTPYEVYVGDDAVARRHELDLNYPVVKGRITHWDNMERVWHHIYYRELKAAPEDRAVLLSCAPATTMKDKVKCCDIFFETLNAPELCIKQQSVLAIFGSGHTTGLSVDLGHDITEINPIYEGGSVNYANMLSNIAGCDLADYMKQSFRNRDLDFGKNLQDVIDLIRSKYSYVTENVTGSLQDYKKKYTLPCGTEIDVSEEAFMSGELYFQPDLVLHKKVEGFTLPDAIVTAALKCDRELQDEMYAAIVIHGGLATIKGLTKRLTNELWSRTGKHANVIYSSEAYAVPWVRCCEIFYEALNAPALCVKPQSVLALFGSGYTTGISVGLGHDITEINPIYAGGSISYANMQTNIAGNEITNYIKKSFRRRGLKLGKQFDDVIQDVKRNYIYVTENCAAGRKEYKKTCTLGFGKSFDVSDESFMAGEMYFQPELVIGKKQDVIPIQDAIVTSILKCDAELQPEMYESIVTYGGMATMPGLNKRLAREIELIIKRPVNVVSTSEAYAAAWLGGAVFAGMAGANRLWVTKKQFEDHGERIVRNRF